MPTGMCSRQNAMGSPTTRCAMPSRRASAAIASPKGPAPTIESSVCSISASAKEEIQPTRDKAASRRMPGIGLNPTCFKSPSYPGSAPRRSSRTARSVPTSGTAIAPHREPGRRGTPKRQRWAPAYRRCARGGRTHRQATDPTLVREDPGVRPTPVACRKERDRPQGGEPTDDANGHSRQHRRLLQRARIDGVPRGFVSARTAFFKSTGGDCGAGTTAKHTRWGPQTTQCDRRATQSQRQLPAPKPSRAAPQTASPSASASRQAITDHAVRGPPGWDEGDGAA